MPRGEGTHDVCQICENGHVISRSYHDFPEYRQAFCAKCGKPTIHQCPSCGNEIRGANRDVVDLREDDAPSFCLYCGRPFPWQTARIQAAKAMAEEIAELQGNDKILLKASIDDIAADTPMTEVAVTRIKKIIPKLRRETADVMKKLLIQVATEAAKKTLTGG